VRSHSRFRFPFVVAAILIMVATVSLWLYGLFLQHEASSLLADVKSLRVGNSSIEEAKHITDRHRKELSNVNCELGSCDYSFLVSNRVLAWTHVVPRAQFGAGFTVLGGTVTRISAYLVRSMPIYPSFAGSAGSVEEYAEIPAVYRQTTHYEFPTPIGKPYLNVRLDRQAEPLQREHAFAFSFRCLTKLGGGCDLPCDYLPQAWGDWRSELESSGFPMHGIHGFDTAYPKNSRCKSS
jgi:hypothetical protein